MITSEAEYAAAVAKKNSLNAQIDLAWERDDEGLADRLYDQLDPIIEAIHDWEDYVPGSTRHIW